MKIKDKDRKGEKAKGFGMQVAEGTGKSHDQMTLKKKVFSALLHTINSYQSTSSNIITIAQWKFSHVPGTELKYLYT